VNKRILFVGLALIAIFAVLSFFMPSQKIDFNSQVKTDSQQKMHHMPRGCQERGQFSVCFFAKMPWALLNQGRRQLCQAMPITANLCIRILNNDPERKNAVQKRCSNKKKKLTF